MNEQRLKSPLGTFRCRNLPRATAGPADENKRTTKSGVNERTNVPEKQKAANHLAEQRDCRLNLLQNVSVLPNSLSVQSGLPMPVYRSFIAHQRPFAPQCVRIVRLGYFGQVHTELNGKI